MACRNFHSIIQKPGIYLGEWMFHKMLAKEDVLHLKYDFVQLELIIEDGMGQESKSLGLYAMEEFFAKQLIERNIGAEQEFY